MKTKPFDIQAALNGAPVVTRSGRKVLSIEYDTYPISVKVEWEDGDPYEDTYTVSGRRYVSRETPDDLFMLDEEGGEEMITKPFNLGAALLQNAPIILADGSKARIVQAPFWVYTGDMFVPYGFDGLPLDKRFGTIGNYLNILEVDDKVTPFNLGTALMQDRQIVAGGRYRARLVQAPIWVKIENRGYAPYDYNGNPLAEGWRESKKLLTVTKKA